MIEIFIKKFSLSKNSTIYNYIFQIISEHEKILQKFLEIWYKIEGVSLRESLRDGNIFIKLNESEKFENFLKKSWRKWICFANIFLASRFWVFRRSVKSH